MMIHTAHRDPPAAAPTAPAVPDPCHSFEALMAGLLAPPDAVAERLAAPALAASWAHAVVAHWSRLGRKGGLDLTQPLYLLDLAPASGQLAAVLLPALADELQVQGLHDWPLCYLACAASREAQDTLTERLSDMPAMRPLLRSGVLSAAHWPARTGQPLVHGPQRRPLFGARNPVVAVALGAWSNQPCRLYAAHYGKLMCGQVHVAAPEPGSQALNLSYEWLPLELAQAGNTGQVLLLERYLAGIPSAALRISEDALAQLDALADFSAGRYLLLSADTGVCSERQLRSQALAPPASAVPGEVLLPVNFHALAWHQRMNGARVAQRQCRDDGWVLHLACRDDILGVPELAWEAWVKAIARAHPDDRPTSCQPRPAHAEAGADAADIDQLLRQTHGDPWALLHALSELAHADLCADPSSAQALLTSLEQTWAQLPVAQRNAELTAAAASLAARLSGWGLARRVLAQHGPLAAPTEHSQLCRLRAAVERATGQAGDALQWAQRAVALAPQDEPAQALLGELHQRAASWLAHRWYAQNHMHEPASGALVLELLDASHQAAIQEQLRDPQIAEMVQMSCREPDAALPPDGAEYALMHAEWGLVGVIGFRADAEAAHFHLWIGTDFQGQAFGGRALQLLLGLLATSGISHLFTAVFRDNQRCRRLLARAGFAEVDSNESEARAAGYLWVYRPTAAVLLELAPIAIEQRLRTLCIALQQQDVAPANPQTPANSEPGILS